MGNKRLIVSAIASYGQAASGWATAQPQRLRWYRGVAAMQRHLAKG